MFKYLILAFLVLHIACNSSANKQQEDRTKRQTKSANNITRQDVNTRPDNSKPLSQGEASSVDNLTDRKESVHSKTASKVTEELKENNSEVKIKEQAEIIKQEAKAVVDGTKVVSKKQTKPVENKVNEMNDEVSTSATTTVGDTKNNTYPPNSKDKANKPEGVATTSPQQEGVGKPEVAKQLDKPDHSLMDNLLKKYVNNQGDVDYKGMGRAHNIMDMYISQLSQATPQDDWSKDEQLAYWINAYNVFTIKMIVENSPVKSIKDLYGGKPWDEKWINLGDKTYSLNDIENGIIRPQFNDPRIHFAVNCAAKSCPPLANKAYTAKNLNSLLDSRTKEFINNTQYNQLDKRTAKISKIFDWYGEDFGNIHDYLNKYASSPIDKNANISYTDYDWSLNSK